MGQMEKMALEFLQSPQTELMVDELMAEVMRPPTDEEQEVMQAIVEEVMRPPTEEELAQMQQSWEDWESNGGLMGTMMGMDGGMAELLGTMEMKMHCKCAMVGNVTNPSERGFKHGGD